MRARLPNSQGHFWLEHPSGDRPCWPAAQSPAVGNLSCALLVPHPDSGSAPSLGVELGSTQFFIAGCLRGFWRPGLFFASFLALCKFPQSFLLCTLLQGSISSMQHCSGYRGAQSSATSHPQALTGSRGSRTTQYCRSRAITTVGSQAKLYGSESGPGTVASR